MSKISDLAQALYEKTAQKKLKWDIIDDQSMSTNIGTNSIIVFKSRFSSNKESYSISILNINGNTVEETVFYNSNPVFDLIGDMMLEARRDSLHTDETIDEIMMQVGQL